MSDWIFSGRHRQPSLAEQQAALAALEQERSNQEKQRRAFSGIRRLALAKQKAELDLDPDAYGDEFGDYGQ